MWDDSKKNDEEREKMLLLEMEQRAYSKKEESASTEAPMAPRDLVIKKRNVKYYVDGERVTARQVSRVQEDSQYMADYIYGKGGRIEEIHYDRISGD